MWLYDNPPHLKLCHVIKRFVTKKERHVPGDPNKNCSEYGTFKESERVSAPSNTFYDSHMSTLENSPHLQIECSTFSSITKL